MFSNRLAGLLPIVVDGGRTFPPHRIVDLFSRELLYMVVCLVLAGCVPMIPVPSVPGPEPYQEEVLAFLDTPDITKTMVEERFGPAPISRRNGQLLIYAAARRGGVRILMILPPFIPATIPDEDFYYLFIEFDDAGRLLRHQLVVSATGTTVGYKCDSAGYCLAAESWRSTGAVPLWWNSANMQEDERTLVTDSDAQLEQARQLTSPAVGCALYLVPRIVSYDGVKGMGRSPANIYYRLDEQDRPVPSALYGPDNHAFARWAVDEGPHVIHAADKTGKPVAEFAFTCQPHDLWLVAADNLPVFIGTKPKASFVRLSTDEARELIADRRLLLLD